jgi:hypothetical protein
MHRQESRPVTPLAASDTSQFSGARASNSSFSNLTNGESGRSGAGRTRNVVPAASRADQFEQTLSALLFPQSIGKRELAEAQNFGAVIAECKFVAVGRRNPLCTWFS